MTDERTDEWLPVPEAALRLGISESAVRSRVGRRTLRARKDNHGSLVVFVGEISVKHRSFVGETSEATTEARQKPASASEMMPVSTHTRIVESLQAAAAAAAEQHQRQIDLLRADMSALREAANRREQQNRADLVVERQRHQAELIRVRVDRAWVFAVLALAIAEIVIVGRWVWGG